MRTVATHNGGFHTDDVFAVAILKLIWPKIKIIRTRDNSKLTKADIVVDVGREYNPKLHKYDHHQENFVDKRKNGITYASAGLIWKHFGKKLIGSKAGHEHIDNALIQPIDAHDNGIKYFSSEKILPYTIQEIIRSHLPNWQEKSPNLDKAFKESVELAAKVLKKEIKNAKTLDKANKIIRNAIKRRKGRYIVLEPPVPPWEGIIAEEPNIDFVVFKGSGEKWCAYSAPVSIGSFERRKLLPEKWADLVNEKLALETGVKDAIYCHKKRFVAYTKSKKGAIKLVEKALQS